MLFEPHTGAASLQCLDAECLPQREPLSEFAADSAREIVRHLAMLALCGWMLLVLATPARAQPQQTVNATEAGHHTLSSAQKSSSVVTKSKTHHRVRRAVHHRRRSKPEAAVVAAAPAMPAVPVAPADQPASPATVEFSQGVLSIRAQNSSLVAILGQVSRETGLHVEGLGHDARIYGQYGPGDVSTTLSELLDGSGYDYVIIGGAGRAAARLVLSPGGSNGATGSSQAAASDQQPAPTTNEPSTSADPTARPQPKTAQEIFNEMRRRHPQ